MRPGREAVVAPEAVDTEVAAEAEEEVDISAGAEVEVGIEVPLKEVQFEEHANWSLFFKQKYGLHVTFCIFPHRRWQLWWRRPQLRRWRS